MKTSYKLFIAGATSLPLLGFAGSAMAANNSGAFGNGFSTQFAERFNLNKDEVSTFMQEQRTARHAEREAKVTEALKAAGFTDAQISAFEAKKTEQREEMQTWRQANPDATREEMQAQRSTERTEFEAWATEQGIDLSKVHETLKDAMPMGGRGQGKKMGEGGHGGGMMNGGN